MSRLAVSACLAALVLVAGPALAQTATPQTPNIGGFPDSPAIPAPTNPSYPGVIRYEVDATDLDRHIVSVRQVIPVTGSRITLLYPKYIYGNHADTGPIQLIAGLTVMAGGQAVDWRRDAVDPYAFHIDIPAGTSELEVSFQWLTQSDNSNWRVVMTQRMLNLQWEKALLYPAGYVSTGITFTPSIRLPEGWQYGVSLETTSFEDGLATFAPTDLYTLADSPMFAGLHYRRVEIDPEGDDVYINMVADEAANLAATDEQIGYYEALITQADRLFGSRHFDRYDFLLGLTNQMGGIGLEHHRSSENTHAPTFFTSWSASAGRRALLPHEYVHSWNGKFMRPADELTPNYNVPTENSLLWVYEGQTEYWGDVLSARTGLHTKEQALVLLADRAAFYQNQPGRRWRNLQDVNNHNLLGYRVPGQWTSWMRGTGDYYDEAALIWLDADTLIRERSNDRRSLDDFAHTFFSPEGTDGDWTPRGYTFDDVVAALNTVEPYDWATFLRTRLDADGPEATAPLDGFERGGYRLIYVEEPNADEKAVQPNWGSDFRYSLGFSLGGASNRVAAIQWDGPLYRAGIGAGWDLIAVGDRVASAEVLRQAVTAAKGGSEPIRLILRNGQRIRTVELAYHDGLRYPRLERIEGTRDRIGDILTARRR